VDTNHESRGHKPSRHVEMFASKSVTSPRQTVCVALLEFSPLQCMGKVGNKVRNKVCRLCCEHKSWKSATLFVSRTFMICVHNFPRGEVLVKVAKSA